MKPLTREAKLIAPLIRAGADGEGGKYREAARHVVEAREKYFVDREGAPDWLGRSFAYREWIGGIYGEAVPAESRSRVAAAMRYHVGEVLRERLAADELHGLGLRPTTAVEEAFRQRSERGALLTAVTGGTMSTLDSVKAITAAKVLLDRVNTADLDELDRQIISQMLAAAAERIRALRKAL